MTISSDALKLLKEKEYFKDGESKWEDICSRVAKAIGSAEDSEEMKAKIANEVYDSMVDMDFIFSTPVLLNADENSGGNLSSCFTLSTKDSIEDICKLDSEFAKIFQRNGGAGTDLSVLRPAKAPVNSSKGYAGGVLSFMEKFDATADMMTKNNPSRKGALKINLNVFHSQIYEFIHAKDDLTKLNRMNISVSLSDKFMKAVENDADWDLKFPDFEKCKGIYNEKWDGDIENWENSGYPVKIYKTVKAKDLLMEIAKNTWAVAEPAVNFQDTMNRDNPNKHICANVMTNP